MKRISFLFFMVSLYVFASNLADTNQIKPLKSFNPPSVIKPNIAQNYMIENQFDHSLRENFYSVSKNVSSNMDKFNIASGFYGKSFYNSALFKYRGGNFYTNLNLNHTKANSYKDGDGKRVNFGYERFNQAFVFGFLPSEYLEHKIVFIHDNIDDDKQPHHQMDPVKTERYITNFNTRIGEIDLSNTLNFNFKYINLKRNANNFDLRKAKQKMFMKVDKNMYEISLDYDKDFNSFHNFFGLAYGYDNHSAKRYMKTPKIDILNAYRFPDIIQKTYKIYDTLSYKFDDKNRISLGFEYVYNDANSNKFDAKIKNPMNNKMFPNAKMLWKQIYGVDFNKKVKKELFNAKLKYDFTPSNLENYAFEVARIKRLPNNPERFTSLFSPLNQSFAIISNPFLKPETHNFIKLSFDNKNEFYKGYLNSLFGLGVNFGGHFMVDRVDDLIIFDRARKQSGVLANKSEIITRNTDALIYNANLFANFNFTSNFATSLNFDYAYGQNKTDSRPLYQIRPFETRLNLDYKDFAYFGSYNVGSAIRYLAKQTRGDFDKKSGLGIDLQEAAKSFATLDLYAGINLKDSFAVRFGVNNIFDKKYAEFISPNHVQAMSPSLINAPGRTFYLSFHTSF